MAGQERALAQHLGSPRQLDTAREGSLQIGLVLHGMMLHNSGRKEKDKEALPDLVVICFLHSIRRSSHW